MKISTFELYDFQTGLWNRFDNDKFILEEGESAPPLPPPPTTEKEIADEKTRLESQRNTKELLSQKLKTAIQMPNIMILAGSGTSLGSPINGPSMWNLWERCTKNDMHELSNRAFNESKYDTYVVEEKYKNIEECLSHCESFIQITKEDDCISTREFVLSCKRKILEACQFITNEQEQLTKHREFIRKLSRRKSKDPRIKLFTTNYDTCFETAANKLGITVIDGFSFSFPREVVPLV